MSPPTRRTLLAVLAAGSLAGCSVESEGPPDGAVHVFNGTNFRRSVRVTVSTAAGERATAAAVLDGPATTT